jgi:hypothetical protein
VLELPSVELKETPELAAANAAVAAVDEEIAQLDRDIKAADERGAEAQRIAEETGQGGKGHVAAESGTRRRTSSSRRVSW